MRPAPHEGTMTEEHFAGCLLGLALGDALGAPFEGGPIERLVWRAIGTTKDGRMRWTDDTQMAVDIAESLVELGRLDADDLARRFAASYRWSRGYGPGTRRVLKRIASGEDWRRANRAAHAAGSFGNGAAMRAPAVGLFYAGRLDELAEAARASAKVTHAHPVGIEGAVLLATATALALRGNGASDILILEKAAAGCETEAFSSRLALAASWLRAGESPSAKEVARRLGNGVAAGESCVTSLYAALRFLHRPFDEMMPFIVRCGGDVDSIGAMAGAVWGAARGVSSLPAEHLGRLEERERIERLSRVLYARAASAPTPPVDRFPE